MGNVDPTVLEIFAQKSPPFSIHKISNILAKLHFFELGEFLTMENFLVDGAKVGHIMDQVSAGSIDPLRFYGRLKISVPLAVMVTKNSKGCQKFLGTDVINQATIARSLCDG